MISPFTPMDLAYIVYYYVLSVPYPHPHSVPKGEGLLAPTRGQRNGVTCSLST